MMKTYALAGTLWMCSWVLPSWAAEPNAPAMTQEPQSKAPDTQPAAAAPPQAQTELRQGAEVDAAARSGSDPAMPKAQEAEYRYSGVVPIKLLLIADANQRSTDFALRVVSVSDRQADVALMVVGALLGSFRTPVSKEDYRGDKKEAFAHPAIKDLYLGMQPLVERWVIENAVGRSFENELQIQPLRFQLVYRGSDIVPDPYDIKIAALVRRKPDSGGFFTKPQQHLCESVDGKSPWGLADWEANEGQRLKAFMQQFVIDCLASVQGALPRLLAP